MKCKLIVGVQELTRRRKLFLISALCDITKGQRSHSFTTKPPSSEKQKDGNTAASHQGEPRCSRAPRWSGACVVQVWPSPGGDTRSAASCPRCCWLAPAATGSSAPTSRAARSCGTSRCDLRVWPLTCQSAARRSAPSFDIHLSGLFVFYGWIMAPTKEHGESNSSQTARDVSRLQLHVDQMFYSISMQLVGLIYQLFCTIWKGPKLVYI